MSKLIFYKDKNSKTYSGAGVIIVEDYYIKNKKSTIPCIILVRNKSNKHFMDFGGSFEKKHINLKTTASKELREESRNLFNISPKHFNYYVDIPSGRHLYRVYIIKINSASRKQFIHNMKIIDKNSSPRSWRETDAITHIPINSIKFNRFAKRGRVVLKDINGKRINIHNRAKKAMFYAENKILNLINSYPLLDKHNLVIHKSHRFTNGTLSFFI
jgi:hypothetical protein